ncbi:hypothetical protein HCN44_010386 [Aphidius gifuensis]|uniref:Uncharacterized protein n=1 Tax=Aphidius gifuensis TaxID=684658 RepID=A0A835CRB4_APHGI|nr:hypothetical protein HCN44_010386 [Aphidius gifuensis]
MAGKLPRKIKDTLVIQLKLKRHLNHKTDYLYETIRPTNVLSALKILIQKPLYKKYGIMIDQEALNEYNPMNHGTQINFIVDPADALDSNDLEYDEFFQIPTLMTGEHIINDGNSEQPLLVDRGIFDNAINVYQNQDSQVSVTFQYLCSVNSIFHGLATLYKTNSEVQTFLEQQDNSFCSALIAIVNTENEYTRKSIWIKFLHENLCSQFEIDPVDNSYKLKGADISESATAILKGIDSIRLECLNEKCPANKHNRSCSVITTLMGDDFQNFNDNIQNNVMEYQITAGQCMNHEYHEMNLGKFLFINPVNFGTQEHNPFDNCTLLDIPDSLMAGLRLMIFRNLEKRLLPT